MAMFVAFSDLLEQIIPGNALAVDKTYPFTQLNNFGANFLNRFEAAKCPAKILKNITLIDTPGVLSGSKQRCSICRLLFFGSVLGWVAAMNSSKCASGLSRGPI